MDSFEYIHFMCAIAYDLECRMHFSFVNFESQKLSWRHEIVDRRSKSYDLFLDFLTRTGLAIFGRLNAKAANEAHKMRNKYVK